MEFFWRAATRAWIRLAGAVPCRSVRATWKIGGRLLCRPQGRDRYNRSGRSQDRRQKVLAVSAQRSTRGGLLFCVACVLLRRPHGRKSTRGSEQVRPSLLLNSIYDRMGLSSRKPTRISPWTADLPPDGKALPLFIAAWGCFSQGSGALYQASCGDVPGDSRGSAKGGPGPQYHPPRPRRPRTGGRRPHRS